MDKNIIATITLVAVLVLVGIIFYKQNEKKKRPNTGDSSGGSANLDKEPTIITTSISSPANDAPIPLTVYDNNHTTHYPSQSATESKLQESKPLSEIKSTVVISDQKADPAIQAKAEKVLKKLPFVGKSNDGAIKSTIVISDQKADPAILAKAQEILKKIGFGKSNNTVKTSDSTNQTQASKSTEKKILTGVGLV